MAQPPGTPDLSGLLAQAQQLQQKMLDAQERAKAQSVDASAGGGMVTAQVSGALQITALKIDPQCVDPRDVGMLQDLVIAAVNQALLKAQEMVQGEMQQVAGGMLPPGLF
jgi:DNA-binding YbaB/EbfC family protein